MRVQSSNGSYLISICPWYNVNYYSYSHIFISILIKDVEFVVDSRNYLGVAGLKSQVNQISAWFCLNSCFSNLQCLEIHSIICIISMESPTTNILWAFSSQRNFCSLLIQSSNWSDWICISPWYNVDYDSDNSVLIAVLVKDVKFIVNSCNYLSETRLETQVNQISLRLSLNCSFSSFESLSIGSIVGIKCVSSPSSNTYFWFLELLSALDSLDL